MSLNIKVEHKCNLVIAPELHISYGVFTIKGRKKFAVLLFPTSLYKITPENIMC